MDVHELSSSASACINSINHYAFDGDMDIVDCGIPGFLSETRELSYTERLSFVQRLSDLGIPMTDIISITKDCERNYKQSGNAYLYIKKYTLAGQQRAKVESVHPLNLAYLKPDKDDKTGIRTFVFSENFDQTQSYQFKFKLIRAFPEWTVTDGVEETIIHFANFTGKSTWYGRPNSLSVLFEMWSESKSGEQRMKVSNSDFVSTMILAFEQESFESDTQGDEDKESTAIDKGKILRAAMTNRGDNASSLMTIDYPNGGNPPTAIEVKVNRDHQYMKESANISASRIYESFDWSRELTGGVNAKGGIGGNILKDLFSIKYTTTLQPLQDTWAHRWGKVFNLFFEDNLTVKYPNLIENFNWNVELETKENAESEIETDEAIDNI